tara:strand:- start:697 stop:1281 length:585 start_codon:yes stop_codon:yes gene_type:complete
MFELSKPEKYEIHCYLHGDTILKHQFPNEFDDINNLLEGFEIYKSWVVKGGGGRSLVSKNIDSYLINDCGWEKKTFHTSIKVDGVSKENPTHEIDCYKNRIAFETEWNNKTEFYDRDLNNFRILHQLGAISLGVIITRSFESLDKKLDEYGIKKKYGGSTTRGDKLIKKINGGGAGGCPVIAILMNGECVNEAK